MNDFGKVLVLAVWLGGVCVGVLGTMAAGICSGNIKVTVRGNQDNKKKGNNDGQPEGA